MTKYSQSRRRRAATTVEYIMILALFVIPIILLLLPKANQMISAWGMRLFWIFKGPFP